MKPIMDMSAPDTDRSPHDDFDAFLLRLGDRDRQNVERHVAFCQTETTPLHARTWKRLFCLMARLAPHTVHTTGQRAVRFFVADGKYRLQLFALEDLRDGSLVVYLGDILDAALAADILRGPLTEDGDARRYQISDDLTATVEIEVLTAAKTTSAPDYYKHMLGWNRSALRIKLHLSANPATLRALESLCTLAVPKTRPPAATPSATT